MHFFLGTHEPQWPKDLAQAARTPVKVDAMEPTHRRPPDPDHLTRLNEAWSPGRLPSPQSHDAELARVKREWAAVVTQEYGRPDPYVREVIG